MIEAVMFWNEPNNRSHWDLELDPDWVHYAAMVKCASHAVRAAAPHLTQVLGGISPIDASFVRKMRERGVLDCVDCVAVHGFPFDWNHWLVDEWPAKIQEIANVTSLPIWISEVGVSTFGSDEVQVLGLQRTASLILDKSDRIHWYSLFDLPKAWPATTRHREAEGSAYYRHFYMGLIREDGTPKPALPHFAQYTSVLGICQWFHYEDPRLESAVRWLRELGVTKLRTGLSWSDSLRPDAEVWFDRQMRALEPFDVTLTFCFTPEACGIAPHHTSPPRENEQYAAFCERMVHRYGR